MGLYRSQRGEKDIETEWKYLRHNNTGSTINTCMENYENSSHACTKGRVNDPFPDRAVYRNWRVDSETEWRGQKKNIRKLVVLKARVTVQFI